MTTYRHTRSLAVVLVLALGACGEGGDALDDDLERDQSAAERDEDGGRDDEGDAGDEDEDQDENEDQDEGADEDAADASRDAGADDDNNNDDDDDAGRPSRDGAADAARDAGADADAASEEDGEDAGPMAAGDDVPDNEHCAEAAAWDAEAAEFEQRVLELTNEARAKGHNCDSEGMFGPTDPLTMEPALRCAARLHSKYMAESGEFSHTQSATGSDPFARMQAAGYRFATAGENIAAGQSTPEQVVQGWLDSDGHCANIMRPNFTELGVGYVLGPPMQTRFGSRAMPYWTQNFGRPR